MQFQFLNDGSDFRSRSGGGYLAKNNKGNGLFWWTILITLLLGLAVFCWFFSIMVFRYPEKPFNYHLLTRLEKLDPVKQFTPLTVPHGKFLGAKSLLSDYYYFNSEKLRYTNDSLKRNYIMNYVEESPVYVKGTYVAMQTRPLGEKDIFNHGWVVRAKSVDMEDVQVELILPEKADNKLSPYKAGDSLTFDNKTTFCTVLHVERTENDGICAAIIPIVYGDYPVAADKHMTLVPPAKINVESTWPIITLDDRDKSASVAATTPVGKAEP